MTKADLKNCIIAICSIFALFMVSEAAYNYHNKVPISVSLYLKLFSRCLRNDNYSCGSYFLKLASDARFKYNERIYLNIITNNMDFSISTDILKTYMPKKLDFIENKLTLIYYYLGLNLYRSGDVGSAISLWQKMTYIEPNLSHTYIELSNLYQQIGDTASAEEVVERCVKFTDPREHCLEFSNSNMQNNIKEEPGFMESEIVKIFTKN